MQRRESHEIICKMSAQVSSVGLALLLLLAVSVCQATLYSSTSSSVAISPEELASNNKLSAVESPVIDQSRVSPKSPANGRQFGEPVYDIQIECNSDSIMLTLNTNLGFNGMIYPKGLSKNSSCMVEYHQTSANITYSLPLRSCNTMSTDVEDGVEYFNTVMVQPHRRLVTNQGRGYHIRCRYQTKERTITNQEQQLSVNLSRLTPPVIGSAAQPGCTMKIYSASDMSREVVAENVRIGDELQLVIALDDQDVYGLVVTNCLVRDGMNWGEQPLIDDHGCPIDEEIMPQFVYSQNLTRASVTFQAHKFPYTSSVYYQCNVRFCFRDNDCAQVPPNCDRKLAAAAGSSYRSSSMEVANEIHARSKRWVDGGELDGLASDEILKSANVRREKRSMSLEVFSGLHVDESHELEKDSGPDSKDPMMAASTSDQSTMSSEESPPQQQQNANNRQQSEKDFCLSLRKLAIIISLISLLLMAAIIIMVACMIQKRKQQILREAQQQYADNSSYYDTHHQSPYMNRAYLR